MKTYQYAMYQEKPYTACVLLSHAKPGKMVMGIAKCCPTDKWDSYAGAKIAFLRALKNEAEAEVDACLGQCSATEASLSEGTLLKLERFAKRELEVGLEGITVQFKDERQQKRDGLDRLIADLFGKPEKPDLVTTLSDANSRFNLTFCL